MDLGGENTLSFMKSHKKLELSDIPEKQEYLKS